MSKFNRSRNSNNNNNNNNTNNRSQNENATNNNNNSNSRVHMIETIEVERMDDDSDNSEMRSNSSAGGRTSTTIGTATGGGGGGNAMSSSSITNTNNTTDRPPVRRSDSNTTGGGSGSSHNPNNNNNNNNTSNNPPPLLQKQRTTSSNDHTSYGDDSSASLAGIHLVDNVSRYSKNSRTSSKNSGSKNSSSKNSKGSSNHRQQGTTTAAGITTGGTFGVLSRSSTSDVGTTNSERQLKYGGGNDVDDDPELAQQQQRRKYTMLLVTIWCLAILLMVAVVVGSVCGSGKCPRGRRKTKVDSSFTTQDGANIVNRATNNEICERANGPLTIGKIPSIGLVGSVTESSTVPVCASGSNSNSTTGTMDAYGRWYVVTGGDEVIRAGTCNRGTDFVTTTDTIVSIYRGSTCDINTLVCVATSDDFCGTSSSTSWFGVKGVNYYIFVSYKVGSTATSTENVLSPVTTSSITSSETSTGAILVASVDYDYVLTVDHEENEVCTKAIGPLVVHDADTFEMSSSSNISLNVVAGSIRSTTFTATTVSCDSNIAKYGMVYYTVDGTGEWMKASTCHNMTNFAARLDVSAGGTTCDNAKCSGIRDSNCNGYGHQIIWQSDVDTRYNLAVYKSASLFPDPAVSGGSTASGKIFGLTVASFEPVANDQCTSATEIDLVGDNDDSLVIGSTLDATFDRDVTTCSTMATSESQQQQPGVWYKVVGTGQTMMASTCHDETDFATEVTIYYAGSGSSSSSKSTECGSSLSCVESAKRQACPVSSKAATYWDSVEEEVYYVYVQGAPTAEAVIASTSSSSSSLAAIVEGSVNVNHDGLANVGTFGLSVGNFITAENDQCINAIALDLTDNKQVTGSTYLSTANDALPMCGGGTNGVTSDDSSTMSTTPGVWYTIVGNGGLLRASTCHEATTFDTYLSIYSGNCDEELTCVVADDNSCGYKSSAAWSSVSNVTYYIYVHGGSSSSTGGTVPPPVGDFVLSVQEYSPAQPNDFCSDAETLTISSTMTSSTSTTDGDSPPSSIEGTTAAATFDNVGVCHAVSNSGPGVWYQVVGTGRRVTAELFPSTNFTTPLSLTVLKGTCTGLTCVAAGAVDNDRSPASASVSWLTTVGETYRLLVHGSEDDSGSGSNTTDSKFLLTIQEDEIMVSNDFCVDATPVSYSPDVRLVSTMKSTNDEAPSCMNVVHTGYGVWYSIVGSGHRLVASTCADETDSTFDTRISVFRNGASRNSNNNKNTHDCANLACVVGDDNGCGGLRSRAVWLGEANVTYYVLLHGPKEGTDIGLVMNRFEPLLANDFCAAAQGPIIPNGKQIVLGTTYQSSYDNVGYCGADNTSPGVWFSVVGTGERLRANTCDNRTDFDTKLSVFSGDSNCRNLTCVTGNDDGCGLQSSLSFDTILGTAYYILLHGWGTNTYGNYAFTVSGSTFFDEA